MTFQGCCCYLCRNFILAILNFSDENTRVLGALGALLARDGGLCTRKDWGVRRTHWSARWCWNFWCSRNVNVSLSGFFSAYMSWFSIKFPTRRVLPWNIWNSFNIWETNEWEKSRKLSGVVFLLWSGNKELVAWILKMLIQSHLACVSRGTLHQAALSGRAWVETWPFVNWRKCFVVQV